MESPMTATFGFLPVRPVSEAPVAEKANDLVAMLEAGDVDAITFTSSSTARNLMAMLGGSEDVLRRTQLFSIGPITTKTLVDAGFEVTAEAEEYTIPGLVETLVAAFGRR